MKYNGTMLFKRLVSIFKSTEKKGNPASRFVISNMPYHSQWESPSLVRKIIREEISAQDDPLWRKSGAKSRKEYEQWARNMCGMACLWMIIKHKFYKDIPIISLGQKCMEFGGYIMRTGTIDGLYYGPFLKFINQEFGLRGEIVINLSLNRIIEELSKGNYIIVSVSHKIRDPNSEPATKGGHLILVLGYDLKKEIFLFHNPSGDTPRNQEYAEISFPQFNKFFAGRGMVIEK